MSLNLYEAFNIYLACNLSFIIVKFYLQLGLKPQFNRDVLH